MPTWLLCLRSKRILPIQVTAGGALHVFASWDFVLAETISGFVACRTAFGWVHRKLGPVDGTGDASRVGWEGTSYSYVEVTLTA